jgi:hypothetical protein
MRRITFTLLILFLIPVASFGQVSVSGLADFELRLAGDDSSPYINQTPGSEFSIYTPNLRLFFMGDISDNWFVNAVLQADHYTGKKLSDPFFSVFNVNWTPEIDSNFLLTAGRFVTPYGSYASRFLSSENPFVHLPLSHASGMPISKTFGFIGNSDPNPATFAKVYGEEELGTTMVYQRMYTQGIQLTQSFGDSKWLNVTLAATTAPASSHLDYGEDSPSFIGRVEFQPVIWAKLGLSASNGTFLQRTSENDSLLIYDISSYKQELSGADLTLNYQYYTLNLEWNQSFWKAPFYDAATSDSDSPRQGKVTVNHFAGEFIYDMPFIVGAHIAALYEYMDEGEIELYERDANDDKINRTIGDWTYAKTRLEVAAGYALDRNVMLKASYLLSDDNGLDFDDNVLAIQLSVLF